MNNLELFLQKLDTEQFNSQIIHVTTINDLLPENVRNTQSNQDSRDADLNLIN